MQVIFGAQLMFSFGYIWNWCMMGRISNSHAIKECCSSTDWSSKCGFKIFLLPRGCRRGGGNGRRYPFCGFEANGGRAFEGGQHEQGGCAHARAPKPPLPRTWWKFHAFFLGDDLEEQENLSLFPRRIWKRRRMESATRVVTFRPRSTFNFRLRCSSNPVVHLIRSLSSRSSLLFPPWGWLLCDVIHFHQLWLLGWCEGVLLRHILLVLMLIMFFRANSSCLRRWANSKQARISGTWRLTMG